MKRLFCLLLLPLSLLVLPVSGHAADLRVLVSIPPVGWFVNQVAGDAAAVEVLVPPGASPHTYEPKPGQMAAVDKADMYLAIGVEFEQTWLPRFTGVNPRLKIEHLDHGIHKLAMAEHHHHEGEMHEHHEDGEEHEHHEMGEEHENHEHGEMHEQEHHVAMAGHEHHDDDEHHGEMVAHEHHDGDMHHEPGEDHGHEAGHEEHGHHHHDGLDPHIWLSPELALTIVDNVQHALTEALPDHAAQFAANAERARDRIRSLGAQIAAGFQGVAARRFVVFHPSWGYFAHEFNLIQMPIEVEGREPSPRELHDLLAEAVEHRVRAVFVQPQMSRRTAEVVAHELSGRVVEADPLAEDWDANLARVATELAAAMKEAR